MSLSKKKWYQNEEVNINGKCKQKQCYYNIYGSLKINSLNFKMSCEKNQYNEKHQTKHPEQQMHQNSSDIDSVNIHPDSEKLLIYCQISEKYSLIQKNFDIPSCFYV
jgi:hypothetical protein